MFFGANITERIKKNLTNVKNGISSLYKKYVKGVSPGGEEFTKKLDKIVGGE